VRIGHGYDVHPLVSGRKLILGGIEINHTMGLLGHSDADVLCHAISDALLGAAALGDIGRLFPDTDATYKNASSVMLLNKVVKELEKHDYAVVNIDATVVMQRPKIASFVEQMRERIGIACDISIDSVSIKATTTESLGFTGREEGVAAYAVVLIKKSDE
jgi:2-C-methyl-D-erythritol 2,4-cyclodiphosphate synthase